MGLNRKPAREPRSTDEFTIIAYHQCGTGVSGSVFGPGTCFGYWWASTSGLRVVHTTDTTDDEARRQVEGIEDWLEEYALVAAGRIQDQRAEAPDL